MQWIALSIASMVAMAATARADCVFEGHARIDDVAPNGTSLSLDLDEEVQVTVRGRTAHVHGISPIEFDGVASARDARVGLARDTRLLGVVVARTGTPVVIRNVAGDAASVHVDAGPSRLFTRLGCADLAFGEAPSTGEAVSESYLRLAEPTGGVLRVFASPFGGVPIVLRDRDPTDWRALPYLHVIETSGRLHVQAELQPGMLLDAWMEPEDVTNVAAISSSGCGEPGMMGGCGWGYGNERYRGAAILRAGTALSDERGVTWGRTVVDVAAQIAITVISTTIRRGDGVTVITETTEHATVYVERMDGLVAPMCEPLGLRVALDAVRLP